MYKQAKDINALRTHVGFQALSSPHLVPHWSLPPPRAPPLPAVAPPLPPLGPLRGGREHNVTGSNVVQ